MDTETQLQLNEGEKANRVVNSDDWKWAKEKLTSIMSAIDSVQTLPKGSNEEIGEEAKARIRAQAIVISWFQEIEGTAEQFKIQKEALKDHEGPPMIVHIN